MDEDWIKMPKNLWDHPRTMRLCEMTGCGEAQIVGALYWLLTQAAELNADGIVFGRRLGTLDRRTYVPGLGAALIEIGWLEDLSNGVRVLRLSEPYDL